MGNGDGGGDGGGQAGAHGKLYVNVWDHHTIGKDRVVGEAEVDVRFSFSFFSTGFRRAEGFVCGV